MKNLEENLKKPGKNSKNSKNLVEIQKTWRKFPKKPLATLLVEPLVEHISANILNFQF